MGGVDVGGEGERGGVGGDGTKMDGWMDGWMEGRKTAYTHGIDRIDCAV